jgi:hypothetical protein
MPSSASLSGPSRHQSRGDSSVSAEDRKLERQLSDDSSAATAESGSHADDTMGLGHHSARSAGSLEEAAEGGGDGDGDDGVPVRAARKPSNAAAYGDALAGAPAAGDTAGAGAVAGAGGAEKKVTVASPPKPRAAPAPAPAAANAAAVPAPVPLSMALEPRGKTVTAVFDGGSGAEGRKVVVYSGVGVYTRNVDVAAGPGPTGDKGASVTVNKRPASLW